ncbi:MAG: DUF2958 domain-containing protein [Desulfobacula sp.]|mgnify:CR=1 FL=1|jgi:hypothetical protein|nr:DUF2958 domain-containing protein [Desulfobacula sp.]
MFFKPAAAQLAIIPRLYQTEEVPLKDKLVYLHFSFPTGSDWWAYEFNGNDIFFGYVILNNDTDMSEAGYFNLSDLADIRIHGYLEIECDQYWQIRPANQVEKICIAQGWTLPDPSATVEIVCPNCKKIILSESDSNEIQCSECKIIIPHRHINSTTPGGLYHGLYS